MLWGTLIQCYSHNFHFQSHLRYQVVKVTDYHCKILNIFQVLGIDSEFCNVEALVTGIVDNWPEYLLKHRRIFTIGICVFMFALGVPMCTEGGVFLFQLMDFYRCVLISSLRVRSEHRLALSKFKIVNMYRVT